MRRRLALCGSRGRLSRRLVRVGIPGSDGGVRGARRVDQRATLLGEPVREETCERDVDEVGVGEVRVPVGEREARRLEEAVQRAGSILTPQPVALEDVERLADGRAADGGPML